MTRRRAADAVDGAGPAACAAAGAALACALAAAGRHAPDRRVAAFAGAGLPLAQAVYLLLGRADRRRPPLRHELAVLVGTAAAGAAATAAAARTGSRAPLAAAWAAHAAWDGLHHRGRAGLRVTRAYPPFCAAFDVVLAAGLLVAPRPGAAITGAAP